MFFRRSSLTPCETDDHSKELFLFPSSSAPTVKTSDPRWGESKVTVILGKAHAGFKA